MGGVPCPNALAANAATKITIANAFILIQCSFQLLVLRPSKY